MSVCCGPLLSETWEATTPEALMRSRYTGFYKLKTDYLLRTWHPSTRPQQLNLDPTIKWTSLTLLQIHWGPDPKEEGFVEFLAQFMSQGKPGRLREISRFVNEQGRWYYIDGQQIPC